MPIKNSEEILNAHPSPIEIDLTKLTQKQADEKFESPKGDNIDPSAADLPVRDNTK